MQVESFLHRQIREYVFSELLGVGGMGSVYKCFHVHLKTQRAIKVLRPDFSRDSSFKARFEQEARILAQLENPYLIRVYEFFEEENHLFLVMEYVTGESLAQRIEFLGSIPIDKAIRIMHQVCEGLSHAHSQGVVHRDLSPDNILITLKNEGGESVKIIDFGIAKTVLGDLENSSAASDGLTTPGVFIGKVRYCSPEQASGKELDHRSDQYSLALILYETITGKPAFQGETLMESLTQRLVKPPPKLRQVMEGRSFPEDLEEVLLKALAINPANRYENIQKFGQALVSVIGDKTVKQPRHVPSADIFQTEDQTRIRSSIDVKIEPRKLVQEEEAGVPGLTSISEDMEAIKRHAYPQAEIRPPVVHPAIKRETDHAVRPKRVKRWPWYLSILLMWAVGGAGVYIFFIAKSSPSDFFRSMEKKIGLVLNKDRDNRTPESPGPRQTGLPGKKNRSDVPSSQPDIDSKFDRSSNRDGPFLEKSAGVVAPRVIQRTDPVFPQMIRAVNLPVTVIVQAVILKDGRVGQTDVLKRGIPEFDQAAMQTVKKWKFTGGTRNGHPADIIMDISITFSKTSN